MEHEHTRRRHRNSGLRKVCGCSRRAWLKCDHSWYLNFRYKKGKHHRISLDRHAGKHLSKSESAELADNLRAMIRGGTYPPADRAGASTGAPLLTFANLGEKWIALERETRVADWRSDKSRLALLGAIAVDGVPLGQHVATSITPGDLETAFRQLQVRGRALAPQTINKYLQTLIHLQRWGRKKGYLAAHWFDPKDADSRPAHRAKPARRSRRLEPDVYDAQGGLLTAGEERRLIAAANPWLQRLIIAALETGCRRGELLKLQWRMVDVARGHLRLPAAITKSAEGRTVVVSARLRAVLELIRKDPVTGADHGPLAHVFGDAAGQRVGSPKKAWEVCVLKAHGIAPAWVQKRLTAETRRQLATIDLHWHDLRHEAGSRWIEAGWPLHHVQQMLGHADLRQTSTYLNATVAGIEQSMRQLDERRGLLQSVAQEPPIAPRLHGNDDAPLSRNVLVN
jgi:integrase